MKKALMIFAVMCGIGFGVAAQGITPIKITDILPDENFKSSYATVYTCVNDTHIVGHLLIPYDDESSMEKFNRDVSEDLWKKAVGISPKRYFPDLNDVQQAEVLLAEVMVDGIIPKMRRWNRYIGNPANYIKYFRTYGFYLNEYGERCVYIVLSLIPPRPSHAGFLIMWDACDGVVYINLNMEKREVIRAYPSSCQSY